MKLKRTFPKIETSVQQLLQAMDNNLSPIDNFKSELVAKTFAGTSPIIWDVTLGTTLKLKLTSGSAVTIEVASLDRLPAGNVIYVVDIENATGGAAGAITFSSTYFSLAGAFVAPANTKRRTIGFYYDGNKLVELCRAGADI